MKLKALGAVRAAVIATAIYISMAALSAFGVGVSGDDAKGTVTGWVRLREALGDEIDAEPESVVTYQGRDGVGEFHVVNLVGGGYVITSGDTEITPILGYSKTGTFDADEDSPMWALLTADVAARAAALEGASGQATGGRRLSSSGGSSSGSTAQDADSPASAWSRLMAAGKSGGKRLQSKMTSTPTDLRVASFVQSKWSQQTATSGNGYSHNYYNYYVPNRYPCGCVATAQAQTMRYFEWPKTSVAAKTFTCQVSGIETNITMQGGTYDWAHMPYVPREVTYDWDNVIGIAKLTSDVGISICMRYKSGGSSSSSLYVGDSLVSTFGYSNAIADYEGGGVKGNTFKKNVIPSLDAKLPVVLGIQGKPKGSVTADAGHSILTDGYGYYNNQLYIHLNFGWSGSDDAWYTPADSDTGAVIDSTDYNFTNITCTVFNIFTNATQYSVIASGRVLDQSGNAISGATVTAKYNNSTYATATSDARGVYALILPPTSSTRTYTVNATHSAYSSTGALSVRASQTKGDTPIKSGNNYSGGYYIAASNSNSYDNDITMEALDLPKLATPESPTATEFETSVSVTLTCATNGATIYYTLDGSTPTASSTLYTGPITLTKTTTVKARAFKSGYSSSDVFTCTFVSATAIDEYYFRHDFSGGTQVFTAGEGTGLTRDQVNAADSSNAKAVNGPDGPGTAFHPGNAWGQFERPAVLHGAWSAAMSLCMDATENGVLVSFGRLNTTDQKEVALLSSSTKSNLYFKVMTTDSNKTKSVENTFTVVTTNDLTEGFHTIVVAYTPASEVLNGVGSFDIYCDGVLVRTVSTDTPKRLGADVGGMQYCYLMSGGNDFAALGAVSSQTNDEVAFYDFRFYDRAFTASEAAKYAAAYPSAEPEPEPTPSLASAYAQSGTENLLLHLDAVENAGVGLHLASPATWADLTGNHAVTNKNAATFSDDAFVANASSYFLGCSDVVKTALTGNDAALTLELVISHPSSQNQYENWVYHGNSGSRNLIVDMRSNNSQNPIVQGVQYRATGWNGNASVTKGTKTAWNKRTYIAVVCSGTKATTYCDGKVQLHSITGSAAPSVNLLSIGASTSGSNPLTSNSEICAVRMTSRILSEDERMRNFFVDSQRFGLEGAPDGYRLTNGVVQVRLTEGVDGFEFSTNGTTWAAGEVWADINQPVTLSARFAARPSMAVAFSDLPAGATVSGGSAAFTPTKPCAVTVSAVQWTNNDGTGSFDSTANWTGGSIPQSGEFIVSISGDTTITVTNAYHLGDMTVQGTGRVTFTGDGSISAAMLEVGSGLTVDAGGVLSMAGFTGAGNVVLRPVAGMLAISSASTLTGDLTVKTDTNTAFNVTAATSVGKFYVDAATNAVVTLTVGSGGSFKATSEAIVQHGVLKQGSATALGTTPKITVQDGGTFDINGKTIRQETPIYIAGAGAGDWPWALASSSGAMASGNYLFDLHLTADATVGAGQLKLGRSNQNSFIYLNEHTLTAKSWLTLRCINTMAGTLDLQAGATFNAYNNLNKQTAYRGTTMIVHEGFTYNNQTDREVYISYLRMYGGTIGYGSTARDFGVWNELHGYGTVKRLVMGSGAKYYPDGVRYLNVPEKLSGTMVIDLGDIDLATAKGRIPLFKVGTAEMLPATEALQFVGGIPKGWHLESSREGCGYDLVHRTFSIIIK